MLDYLKFHKKVIVWIRECVQTVSYSIDNNGEYTPPFTAARGLRQGDMMSPYLFPIAIEYLSSGLNELQHDKGYRYHPKCAKMKLTHLCYADGLLFARGNTLMVKTLHNVFEKFSAASRLKPK